MMSIQQNRLKMNLHTHFVSPDRFAKAVVMSLLVALSCGHAKADSGKRAEYKNTIEKRLTKEMKIRRDSIPGLIGYSDPDSIWDNISRIWVVDQEEDVDRKFNFRATQYAFQKPLSSPGIYPGKRLLDRMFMSFGAGASWLQSSPTSFRVQGTGYRAEMKLGDWITPFHGWRLGLAAGIHKTANRNDPYYVGGSLDYLMNLTAMVNNGRHNLPAEFIASAGLEYQRSSCGNVLGARLGMQVRYNFAPSMYIYVEPRVGLYTGGGMTGDVNWTHCNVEASMMAGLGFRLLRGAERMAGSRTFEFRRFDGHMFYGLGGSLSNFVQVNGASAFLKQLKPGASLFVGYWFTPTSGLRFNGSFSGVPDAPSNRMVGTDRKGVFLGLDYTLNLNSAFGGYRPTEFLEVDLNVGLAIANVNKYLGPRTVYPGLEASVQALMRINPNWGIYIEPQVRIFAKKFYDENHIVGHYRDLWTSLNLGVRYTIGEHNFDYAESWGTFARAFKKGFVEVAGGVVFPRPLYGKTGSAYNAAFGRWFTPVSGWRIGLDGELMVQYPRYISASVAADYLVNISSAVAGCNPDRFFTVVGSVGVYGGVANFYKGMDPVAGVRAGLQGRFRVSDNLDIFVEPQGLLLKSPTITGSTISPQVRVMAGLSYKLGHTSASLDAAEATGVQKRVPFYRSNRGQRANFASLAGGPGVFSLSSQSGSFRVSGAIDVYAGRWFSSVSALRFGMSYDFATTPYVNAQIGSLHLDYMLDVTNIFEQDDTRKFNILGVVGAGFGWSNVSSSPIGVMAQGGVQFRYRLNQDIDLHIEPSIGVWARRVFTPEAYRLTKHRAVGMARLMFGASYKF